MHYTNASSAASSIKIKEKDDVKALRLNYSLPLPIPGNLHEPFIRSVTLPSQRALDYF